MSTTKLTGLTDMNHYALRTAMERGVLDTQVHLTRTTVTFPWEAASTVQALDNAKTRLRLMGFPSRSHPVSSLNAVIRKAARIAASQDAV